jgi:regulator of sigma E protease
MILTILDGVKSIVLLGLILIPLVLVHEFGHFIIARLVHIRVLEFGLGFPPRAKVIGHDHETEYTLNWLPIGGFVRLEGEETDSDDPRSFVAASLKKQLFVLLAGVTMNVLTAVILLFIVAWAFNPIVAPTIGSVSPDSPAASVGLRWNSASSVAAPTRRINCGRIFWRIRARRSLSSWRTPAAASAAWS